MLDRTLRYKLERQWLLDNKHDLAEKLSRSRVDATGKTITIEIPEDFSVSGVRNVIIDKLIEIELTLEECRDIDAVLADDKAMMKMFGRSSTIRKGESVDTQRPIIRAAIYGNSHHHRDLKNHRLELLPGRYWEDPHRPLLMRGSKEAMQSKFQRRSTMAGEIAERYLRFIKFTCFDKDSQHWTDTIINLRNRLSENGWYIHHDLSFELRPDTYEVWIDGQRRRTNDDDVKKIIAERNDRASKAIMRAHEEQEAQQRWRQWQELKDEGRIKQHRQNLKLKRKRRAEQIAAYELLSELKTNRGSNAKS